MFSERFTVMLSADESRRVRRLAARDGRSTSAVVRDAIDAYLDDESTVRRDAIARLLGMNAPVDDWEVMKAQIEASRYPELPGWNP